MKYINQLEHPHMLYVTRTDPEYGDSGKTTTVRSSGCGLCSAIMVADRLLPSYDFDLPDAIELSYEMKANHGRGTDPKLFFPAFAKKLGLDYKQAKTTDELIHCLQTGGAAVVHVGKVEGRVPLFTKGGHYMAVIGVERDGRLAILDPSYFPGKYDEEGRQGKVEVKQGVISLCTPEILAQESEMKAIPYHLFWRP